MYVHTVFVKCTLENKEYSMTSKKVCEVLLPVRVFMTFSSSSVNGFSINLIENFIKKKYNLYSLNYFYL